MLFQIIQQKGMNILTPVVHDEENNKGVRKVCCGRNEPQAKQFEYALKCQKTRYYKAGPFHQVWQFKYNWQNLVQSFHRNTFPAFLYFISGTISNPIRGEIRHV